MQLRNHLMMAFATPVVAYPWPDSDELNRELAELVLAEERRSDGVNRSNVGGWHSATDLLDRDAAPIGPCAHQIATEDQAAFTLAITVGDTPRSRTSNRADRRHRRSVAGTASPLVRHAIRTDLRDRRSIMPSAPAQPTASTTRDSTAASPIAPRHGPYAPRSRHARFAGPGAPYDPRRAGMRLPFHGWLTTISAPGHSDARRRIPSRSTSRPRSGRVTSRPKKALNLASVRCTSNRPAIWFCPYRWP